MTDLLFSSNPLETTTDFGSNQAASALEGLSTEVGDRQPASGMLLVPQINENATGAAGGTGNLDVAPVVLEEIDSSTKDTSVDSLTGMSTKAQFESDDPLLADAAVVEGGELTIEQATAEVATIYREVLGREADAGGLEFWTGRAIATSVAEVKVAIANSPEGEARVNDIYREVLGRESDPSGLNYWTDVLGEFSLNFVKANIANSAEAEATVLALYQETTGDTLDPNGPKIAAYIDILETSSLDALVASGFALTMAETGSGAPLMVAALVEGGDLTIAQARLEVGTIYREVLGREGDANGIEFWAGRVLKTSVAEVKMAIANSPEGEARVNDIYLDVLGRESDPSGLDYWTDILGETALNFVRANIENSEEAKNRRAA